MSAQERNSQSGVSFQDWLSRIGSILGFFVTLVSVIINMQKWIQEAGTLRLVSLAGFVLYLLSSIWLAFKAKSIKPTLRWASLGLLYVCTALYSVWIGTWICAPAIPQSASTITMPVHAQIANAGWAAVGSGDYTLAISITEVCISRYESEAMQIQQGFLAIGKPSPPIGTASDEQKRDISSYGPLNDLASCYWIKGYALEKLNRIDEARQAYMRTQQFTYARVWDPNSESFWSPAQSATERLSKLPSPTPSPTSVPTFTPTYTPTPSPTSVPTFAPTYTSIPSPTSQVSSSIILVVDDQDSGFIKFGTEQFWNEADIGYRDHMWWTLGGDDLVNWAQWCLQLPVAGLYKVEVFIPRDKATTARATYKVQHRDGETEITIDQHKFFDEWIEIGQFEFDQGVQYCVILTDKTGEGRKRQIGFDAVQWSLLSNR